MFDHLCANVRVQGERLGELLGAEDMEGTEDEAGVDGHAPEEARVALAGEVMEGGGPEGHER